MGKTNRYTLFLFSSLLMCIVLYIIYPHYKYYLDPDATSYLTIAARYATGDFAHAINGYWSPWSCWLTALLIKSGISPIPSSIIINTLGAIGFVGIANSFFIKFDLDHFLQSGLNIALALFLCFAIFWQSFADLWECFFLLSALRLLIVDKFSTKPLLWVLAGIIGSLAYFAKAYSFPFFILSSIVCTWVITKGSMKQWLVISSAIVGTMIIFSMPWIYLLHNKYNIWTTATAGSLNLSWYLIGHPHWKPEYKYFIPPTYPDSPYYWEDPYFANADTPHFWNSWHLFVVQLLRLIYNFYKLIVSLLQVSIFFPLIIWVAIKNYSNKIHSVTEVAKNKVITLSFLLFPIGYLLINFESRYLWYMIPIGMVLGSMVLQANRYKHLSSKLFKVLFFISFLIFPFYQMVKLYDSGKPEFTLAQKFKELGFHGNFTSNSLPPRMAKLAYFSGSQYYYYVPLDPTKQTNSKYYMDTILSDLQKTHVRYYIDYKDLPGNTYSALNFATTDFLNRGFKPLFEMDNIAVYDLSERQISK